MTERPWKNKEWLEKHYYELELSTHDMAELAGCTRKNIEYWMRKYDIPRRSGPAIYTARCLKKISETGKGREPFSKGLTKHDHPSIMRTSEKLSGERSPTWSGGKPINYRGYRLIKADDHPKRDKDGYVLEHRAAMESLTGRYLEDGEVVHHRDGNRLNNSPENLFLFPSNSAHVSFHNYKKHRDPSVTEEEFMEVYYGKDCAVRENA
ncbi:hypothetical protein I532_04020 [Brevibacillus borstelensis AK1]|uniref:HNH nuclease domain-containing protein n=1 Tax=Brevibacillus borstelensis AK1 TaxID=1300222 RepID=M8DMN8_9BACL|nr:HNH endonuclease signature motif containing protein [Brevibacillus borstelensis]EMT54742.1 hypothetical protein I532_04020 [Brevibacillus borstelensis AK1]